MMNYPYDSLIRSPLPDPTPSRRGDALPMTSCNWTSSTTVSRCQMECDADGGLRRDNCNPGNDTAAGGSNLYFSIMSEEEEGKEDEEERDTLKGQVCEGCGSPSFPSSTGEYAYADCYLDNDVFQRGIAKSMQN